MSLSQTIGGGRIAGRYIDQYLSLQHIQPSKIGGRSGLVYVEQVYDGSTQVIRGLKGAGCVFG